MQAALKRYEAETQAELRGHPPAAAREKEAKWGKKRWTGGPASPTVRLANVGYPRKMGEQEHHLPQSL
jgi:hypothetical protein